ncbi:PBSX family phage terminase large subunit [Bacteroides acidifaciens]|uniref:PBSX family phage terminase large subunit n=1 Tax=Bacteroides acidifaciens TaxID=85831 RepID=UPI0025AF2FDA|nr:PBSX family phage terminase large subunit [Bacteroides acidifaciens]
MEKLTPKQKAFADNYIKNGGNAEKAALDAGYSKNYAKAQSYKMLDNVGISTYIAERQEEIEKQNGHDIMTLTEIQERRSRIGKGLEVDSFGFAADFSSQLKAMSDLEKILLIKQEQEEKQRAAEEALRNKTYHMDLDNIPDAFHAAIRAIRNRAYLEYVLKGGRGSTKSSTFGMIIVELLKNYHDIHALVCRKVANTIKDSVYNKIVWAIRKQGLEDEFKFKTSPFEITYKPTGQKIYFRGADDPDKIKSINPEFGYIGILWYEELDQFAGDSEVRKIEQSAIRGGELAWIFKSFNPPKTANNWANEYVTEVGENTLVHSSTYLDVPRDWLGQPFIDQAEHLKEINPEAYEHEYGGVANGNGGMVFEYLEFRTITDEEISHMDKIFQGADWGYFPDPYAFIRAYYNAAKETIYLIDENYVNKQQNAVTAQWIKDKGYTDYAVTCDSAEPKSVVDYRDMGISARGAIKGPGSVEYGMKWLQSRHIVIDMKRTPNAGKELKEYEYERDKDGEVISGYPDANNHAIDALRYAFEQFYNKRGNHA